MGGMGSLDGLVAGWGVEQLSDLIVDWAVEQLSGLIVGWVGWVAAGVSQASGRD